MNMQGMCLGFADSEEELADMSKDASEGDWCIAVFDPDGPRVYSGGRWEIATKAVRLSDGVIVDIREDSQ